MRGLNAVHAVVQNELAQLARGIPCAEVHPEDGARCVLKRWPEHVKHKTEQSRRWESERD